MNQDDDIDINISYKVSFDLIRLIGSAMLPSKFTGTLYIDPIEDDGIDHIDTALTYFKYWIDKVVSRSIAFGRTNSMAFEAIFDEEGTNRFNNTLMLTPSEPTDEMIALLLMAKFNAFGKGKVEAVGIEIESSNHSGVTFNVGGDPLLVLPDYADWMGDERTYFDSAWWTRDDASSLDVIAFDADDVTKTPPWAYSIAEAIETPKHGSTKPSFTPKVIELTKK